MVDVGICISSHFKEDLAWAEKCYLKNSKSTKKLKGTKK